LQNILIVEDHHDTRQWWESHMPDVFPESVTMGASSLMSARKLLDREHFNFALVDINLPDGSGIDLVREISQSSPDTYCVISTIFDDDKHIFPALEAGAMGYLIKDQPRERQIEQLREIVTGQPPLSPGIARKILNHFSQARQAKCEESGVTLTKREVDVLQMIAKGYSRPETGKLLGLTSNTVSSYTKIIYQKLGVSRRAEAVVEAVRLGLINPDA